MHTEGGGTHFTLPLQFTLAFVWAVGLSKFLDRLRLWVPVQQSRRVVNWLPVFPQFSFLLCYRLPCERFEKKFPVELTADLPTITEGY